MRGKALSNKYTEAAKFLFFRLLSILLLFDCRKFIINLGRCLCKNSPREILWFAKTS